MENSNQVNAIPSGSLLLDYALRSGGIPRGIICEISGPVSSGKTTLCQHIIAEAQRQNNHCAFIDTDYMLDIRYAERCGVNLDNLIACHPQDSEQALDMIRLFLQSKAIDVIVVDSISSLIHKAEFESTENFDLNYLVDRQLSKFLRQSASLIRKANTLVILTNRADIRKPVYHKLKQNPNRLALKLHANLHLQMKRVDFISIKDKITGQKSRITIVKSRLVPCFDCVDLDIMYNKGLRKTGEIFDLGLKLSVIQQKASLFQYKDVDMGPGRELAIQQIENSPDLEEDLTQDIRQKLEILC